MPIWHGVVGLMISVGCALLLRQLWLHLELPDRPPTGFMAEYAKPTGLARFIYLGFPLAAWLPTLALILLEIFSPAPASHLQARRIRLLDAVSYLLLPGLAGLAFMWESLGNAWLMVGLCFLGLVTFKGWLLAELLWWGFLDPAVRPKPKLGIKAQTATWLCAFLVLGLSSLWVQHAVSSVGDEVGYTLLAHNLTNEGKADKQGTVEQKDYGNFYWARFSKSMAFGLDKARTLVFPHLISPAYALGGRPGVLLFLAAITALLAVQLMAWLEGLGIRAGPAAATSGLVIFSAPVFFMSQQIYPELLGALVMVAGLRLISVWPRRPWLVGLGVLCVAALLVALKFRLAPLALGLVSVWLFQALSARLGARLTLLIFALGVAALAVGWWLLPADSWIYIQLIHLRGSCQTGYGWWSTAGIVLGGLSIDQTFGIISTAPVFLLALAGIPVALKRYPVAAFAVLASLLIMLEAVHLGRWCLWHGGFSSAGRFLIAILPACAVFLAPVISALSRPWWRVLVLLPAAAGLLYAWLLTLLPQLRYSGAVGINPLVQVLERQVGFPLYYLLPSSFTYSPLYGFWLAALLAAALFLALVTWRYKQTEEEKSRSLAPEEGLLTALLLVGAFGAWLLGARLFPPAVIEAEHMPSAKAPIYSTYVYPDDPRGRALSNGHDISGFLHFPGGPAKLRMRGYSNEPGQIILFLDGVERGRYAYQGRKDLVMDLGSLPRGFHLVRLYWSSCERRACYLLVDSLERE
jgi:hypothetical protein